MAQTRILLMAFLSPVYLTLLNAQTNTGGVGGTVTDKSCSVVAGAVVTVTNAGTGQVVRLRTSEAGTYALPNLEPVYYIVAAEAPGFKKAVAANVKVDTATQMTVDLTIESGDVSQPVTVEAAP